MPDRDVTILFGAPGTGKTTYLIGVVKRALERGIDPARIAYLSFSRKAAREAIDKASAKLKLSHDQFPWFRTIHSTAFKILDLRRHEVMATQHYKELGDATGFAFQGTYDMYTERPPIELNSLGDRCLAIYARAKARQWSLEEEWRYTNEWDLPWPTVNRFAQQLEGYKRDRGLVDFCDMVDQADAALDVDLIIIDEAQDLTLQGWAAARKFGSLAREVYIAGDDDQAIYSFSGATPRPLLTIRGERKVLPRSWRLPSSVKSLADHVSSHIRLREAKQFSSRDSVGLVSWVREPEDIDLSHGTWLLLCRNRSQLSRLEAIARRQNVVYHLEGKWSNESDPVRAVVAYERIRHDKFITHADAQLIASYLHELKVPKQNRFDTWSDLPWPFANGSRPDWMDALVLSDEDREYIRGLRRRGESLSKPGRVVISTVHGAKGGEAENVLLLTDISGRVAANMIAQPDDEWRVLYVGVSRALNNLYLVQPSTRNFWNFAA